MLNAILKLATAAITTLGVALACLFVCLRIILAMVEG